MQEQLGNANNHWVFREGKITLHGQQLRNQVVQAAISLLEAPITTESVIDSLLRAGEFEAALGDTMPQHFSSAEALTSLLARCLWEDRADSLQQLPAAVAKLQNIPVPDQVRVSPPEGFAYYALHPLDFASLAETIAGGCSSAAIIGIRSIGTTLSAIVLGAFRHSARHSGRITVRPTGHPYDRVTQLTGEQKQWIAERVQKHCTFLVVDEGPGRSGSSFLSVAEALEDAGVPSEQITLVGSRPIDPDQLCADNAPTRWRRYNFLWPRPAKYSRFNNDIYIGGGHWRETLLGSQSSWPSCWPQMERFKFLSPDHHWVYKFEGFGRFGQEVLQRAQQIAAAQLGPAAEYADDGMIRVPLIKGKILDGTYHPRPVLDRLADYCAFRSREFTSANPPSSQLAQMLRFNVREEFGRELDMDLEPLSVANTLADGRMQPHEWLLAPDSKLLKVDACTHGDDHFFPGPTDIAWDLAGVIVEWGLGRDAAQMVLSRYQRLTGDPISSRRLLPFLLAYSVFRMSYCKMALSSVVGTPDFERLFSAAQRYRNTARHYLNASHSSDFSPTAQPQPFDSPVTSHVGPAA